MFLTNWIAAHMKRDAICHTMWETSMHNGLGGSCPDCTITLQLIAPLSNTGTNWN